MEQLSSQPDEVIVQMVCAHNQEYYALLMKRYQHALLRYVTSLINNEAAAQDVVQETFIKAFINLKSFDTSKKFSSWIYRIAHNEAMNAVKKYRHETRLPDSFDLPSEQDIELDFSQQETVEWVQQCITKLPLIYAEPLMLRYVDDRSYNEISYILRIPQNTVSSRINRAKKLMQNICQHH